MKRACQIGFCAVLLAACFAAIAQGCGYGLLRGLEMFGMQVPLCLVLKKFNRAGDDPSRGIAFIAASALAFFAIAWLGVEDLQLCVKYGFLHRSDDLGLIMMTLGMAVISAAILAAVLATLGVERIVARLVRKNV